MTIPAPAIPPEPTRGTNRKAVGLLLAPGPGRFSALAIVGIPLIIFLIIGFTTTGGGGGPSYDTGGQVPSQYQQPFAGSTTQSAGDSGGAASPAVQATTPSAVPSAADSPSPYVSDSSSDTASASASATASASASGDSGSPGASATASGPAATVLAAYAAIDRQDYQTAYDLGLAGATSYAVFAQDYGQYSNIAVVIDSVQGDVVTATLTLTYTDGGTKTAHGTYTVSNGLIDSHQVQ